MLTRYMNNLSMRINIFKEEIIVNFLKQEFNSNKMKQLSEQVDVYLSQIEDHFSLMKQNIKNNMKDSMRLSIKNVDK